jgi:hypothetical protein
VVAASLVAPAAILVMPVALMNVGSVPLNARGNLATNPNRELFMGSILNAAAVLAVAGFRGAEAAVPLPAPGLLQITTTDRETFAYSVLNARGNLTISPLMLANAYVNLNARANLSILGTRMTFGAINLNALGNLQTNGIRVRYGAVNLFAPGGIMSDAVRSRRFSYFKVRNPATGLFQLALAYVRYKGTDPFTRAYVWVRPDPQTPFQIM